MKGVLLMAKLVPITEKDYREYRKSFSKIQYSFSRKGEFRPVPMELIHEASMVGILKKGDFLDIIEDPRVAMYFFKNDDGDTIGVTSLVFQNGICDIKEFAVFDEGKGLGSELYELVSDACRQRGVYEQILWCPFSFEGSQSFWEKLGFYQKKNSEFYKRIPKKKK